MSDIGFADYRFEGPFVTLPDSQNGLGWAQAPGSQAPMSYFVPGGGATGNCLFVKADRWDLWGGAIQTVDLTGVSAISFYAKGSRCYFDIQDPSSPGGWWWMYVNAGANWTKFEFNPPAYLMTPGRAVRFAGNFPDGTFIDDIKPQKVGYVPRFMPIWSMDLCGTP